MDEEEEEEVEMVTEGTFYHNNNTNAKNSEKRVESISTDSVASYMDGSNP